MPALTRSVHVSAVTACETTTKVRLGKVEIAAAMLADFAYAVQSDGFRLLDLDAGSAARAGQFESAHRDPFDRLLAAQALTLGAMIVTPDPAFAEFGVPAFW